MADESLNWKQPPVVELVLGVQFEPLVGLTNGHLGWLWRELSEEWTEPGDAPPLEDQFERFQEGKPFGSKMVLKIQPARGPGRLQVRDRAGDRMLQFQATRFILNWVKKEQQYPSYTTLRGEFESHFEWFARFVADAGLGDIRPNQWEITYIDLVQQHGLWQSPADWGAVFPGLFPFGGAEGLALESAGCSRHFVIPEHRGRLHVETQHTLGDPGGEQGLLINWTARGPAADKDDVLSGLDLGREVCMRVFQSVASAEALACWRG